VLFVIVSAEENPATIRRAIDLGACGFIPKSSPLSAISDAVTTVLSGEQWLPDTLSLLASNDADSEEREFAKRLAQLTPHQFKVLKMLAEGLLNKQIAYTLDISESTVKQHVSAVLRKLQVINRTQASVMFKQLMGQGE
jgi:DNA-binding NarL/FixJ family response regulator